MSEGERLSKSLQSMGTTFIKLGQFLVTRPDIIGDELAKQLEQSQNLVDQFGGVETVIDNDQFLKNILTDFSRKDRDIQSQNLAKEILKELDKIGPVHKIEPQKANFVVLKSPTIPSILVETAFISNPTQEKRLTNSKQQQKIANAIYQGIIDYYLNLEKDL